MKIKMVVQLNVHVDAVTNMSKRIKFQTLASVIVAFDK